MTRTIGRYDDDDFPDDDGDDDLPQLLALGRFIAHARRVAWFARLGDFWAQPERDLAQAYLDALGFPEMSPAALHQFEDAAEVAENTDWNSPAWEAEEALRSELTQRAVDLLGEEVVTVALTHLAAELSDLIHDSVELAAEKAGVGDAELIRAAAGAAIQACHHAALVLLATDLDGDVELESLHNDAPHPFSLRFRLFEAGRWPVALVGGSYHIF